MAANILSVLLSPFTQDNITGFNILCSVRCQVLVVGDLKFYAQLLGRENMSSSWCMWCTAHPSDWKYHPIPTADRWTIDKIKQHKDRIDRRELREARDIRGIVNDPVWDFIEPENYMFPQLHAEIGLVNNMLDKFYSFIDDQVEAISPEEALARNTYIMADVAVCNATQALSDWKETEGPQLEFNRYNRIGLTKELKKKNQDQRIIMELRQQQQELDTMIAELVNNRKALETDVTLKRKALTTAKASLKAVREKKRKLEMPVFSDIENILLEYGITAAAYHGGKLNGVDCRELLTLAKTIFERFKTCLLSVSHPERCSDAIINQACDLHRDICITLDSLTSKLRMKQGEPQENDFQLADAYLVNLHYLWTQANLSFTPKIHCLLNHAVEQMRKYSGIGDTLEDDVERIHQISAKIESRVSRMKNKGQQAHVHSKMEAIQNCSLVREKIEESQQASKRVFKKRNLDVCAVERGIGQKKERDESRAETQRYLEEKPHQQLLSNHDKKKAEMMNGTT